MARAPRNKSLFKNEAARRFKKSKKRTMRYKQNHIESLRLKTINSTIIPDRMLVKNRYVDITTSLIRNVGYNYGSYRFRMNSAFDVDPILLSSPTIGHVEWSTFYQYYRVKACRFKVWFTNLEPLIPFMCIVCPTNVDLGSNYTPLESLQGNAYCQRKAISVSGGQDRAILQGYINMTKFVGSNQVNYDDNYAAAVTASPVNQIYLNVGVQTMGVGPMTDFGGVAVNIELTLYTEYYERKDLIQ